MLCVLCKHSAVIEQMTTTLLPNGTQFPSNVPLPMGNLDSI